MNRTPAQFYADYWQHLPHTAETLNCGCIIVTYGLFRYRIESDGNFSKCVLADGWAREWATGEVERMVKV